MRYGFSGTRRLKPHHREKVEAVLQSLSDATEFTTGGALGIDGAVARALRELYPHVPQRIIFPADPKYTDRDIYDWAVGGGAELIQMPDGSDYRARNGRILDFSDVLIGFLLREAALEPRSGTWMTIRMAEKRAIPVNVVLLE